MRPHLALLGAALIWGLSYLATKIALVDMGPFEVATARMLIASAIFMPVFLRTRHELPIRDAAAMGALGVTLYYATFNVGLREARAVDAGVIQASIPAASALLAIPLLGERSGAARWLGIALSSIGVVVLVSGTAAGGTGSLVGNLWIVASVVVWAVYSVTLRRLARRASGAAITAATLIWGTVLLLPIAAVELTIVTPALTVSSAVAIAFLALFASVAGYSLWSYGLARIDAAVATTYLNLLPLVAAISGVLLLGERIGVVELLGAVLIVAGVVVTGRTSRGRT